jgi:hypothetical protein
MLDQKMFNLLNPFNTAWDTGVPGLLFELLEQQENLNKYLNFLLSQRIAADTSQSFEITNLSRAYYLRSSVLFLFFLF